MFLFVCTPLTFLPLSGRAGGMLFPLFLILNSKMGSIVCISLVHDCIRLFSFVHLYFSISPGGGEAGDMLSPLSDFGFENVLNRLYKV